ncbi:MAG: amidohydrolase family protein [Candidatus Odinarchaeota archaeon]
MHFSLDEPLKGLTAISGIWDSHFHVWDAEEYLKAENWLHLYGITKITGLATPEIKKELEKADKGDTIAFAYYLPPNNFGDHATDELITHVEKAHSLGYPMVKMWFGPRFLDFTKSDKPFRIDHPSFEPVFSLIEDYKLSLDIHIADPDISYEKVYLDKERYRTKEQAITEFKAVLERHPSMKTVGVHLGCLPEHLEELAAMLDKFPNYYVDTASTRWMVRELGKNTVKTREFFNKYQDRILFATDLSVGWQERPDEYFATRLWSQRLFWETTVRGVDLPFKDEDNRDGQTRINGLELPRSILDKLYWKNAEKFFS